MFSTLSPGALGLDLDHPRAVDLAAAHGFGGVDPDLGHFRTLGLAGTAEHAAAVREKGLQWGMAGLPIALDAPTEDFRRALTDLPADLELLAAAGVTRVGTWIRPMHQELDHRQNWRLHLGRITLVAALLEDAGIRLGLEYIGPKTLWSTERFPFLHSLRETRELIAETGAENVGLILDTYHWHTAGEDAAQLEGLTDADIASADLNDARADRELDEQQDLDRRLPFDTGVIDLDGFLRALGAAGYTGPVKIEPFMASLAERPVDEVLAQISGLLDRALTVAGGADGRG
ncbi:MAG: sugar phosphate isomerase/epimerase family protein [Brachybacterium sp.]|uniref:sugar phosphate isomerase/epimerase family protein n=1 Tax=Brachybacterium sp. TaxID=1891286 RepID=UPI003F8E76B3